MEHSFQPGECRYGRRPDEDPKSKKAKALAKEENLMDAFRREAQTNKKIAKSTLTTGHELGFDNEQAAVLKYALSKVLMESMEAFETKEKEQDYIHWLRDPITKAWIKQVLKEHIVVSGVCAHLQPWTKPVPTPHLRAEEAFLRLMIRGNIEAWRVLPMEDLRELSHHQCHEPVDFDEDWLICIFGHYPSSSSSRNPEPPLPSTPAPRTPAPGTPTPGTPKPENVKRVEVKEEPVEDFQPVDEAMPMPYEADDVQVIEPVDDEEESKMIKPIYDFRRIFKKLPTLATTDEAKAKRLLLGSHERMWHCPVMDFKNVLSRCGMPPEVLQLAKTTVSACAVCCRFTRATRRPQVKSSLARDFNEVIQIDSFQYRSSLFICIVDEATRYKVAGQLKSRELSSFLDAVMQLWFRHFGPCRRIVCDQEGSLMSQEAAPEFDRLGIERVPMGTTSGAAGKKHTGTGMVERHIGLLKMTMSKCSTEAARFSITPELEELAAEAAMAHNMTLNIGGYSPAMMVFGILPRGYLDVEDVPLSVASADTDQSVFERAVRLRQIALQAAQASILEDRIVRAGRTRPEKLDIFGLIAGSTQVEIFRDDGHYGWRGPALLLKINDADGTCIVEYQGRPYLMSLRHIRVYRGSFFSHCHADNIEEICEEDLLDLQRMVEKQDPYKLHTIGFLLKIAANSTYEWIKTPSEMKEADNEILMKAKRVASFFSRKELHGIRFGRAVKQIYVPKFPKGVLISWPKGSKQYVMMEHNGDNHLVLKKIMHTVLEDVCHLYMYYFTIYNEEAPPAQITTRRPPEPLQQDPMDTSESKKRDGPETRTIVMAPEKKRARYEYADDEGPSEQELLLRSLWWMTRRPLKINYQSDETWFDNHSLIMQYNRTPASDKTTGTSKLPKHYIFHIHGKKEEILYMDLRSTEIFRVDSDTDVMTEEQLARHWEAFEQSDFAELKQFVDEGAFFKMHISQITDDMVIVDCTWVRKFKRNPDRTMKAKSRLCARGFSIHKRAPCPHAQRPLQDSLSESWSAWQQP